MGALEIVEVLTRELMLFAAVGLLIGGIDDLALDVLFFVRRAWGRFGVHLPPADLSAVPTSRIALFVPTWREAAVIGPMLRTLLARLAGDFTVYVAVYANDAETASAVAAVAAIGCGARCWRAMRRTPRGRGTWCCTMPRMWCIPTSCACSMR